MTLGRLVTLIALTAVAIGIALLLQRRRPDPPSAPSYRAPPQLDRDDFTDPTAGRLLVMFGSVTCETCPKAWAVVEQVLGDRIDAGSIAVERVDVETDPARHKRYRIDGVPTTLVANADGVVLKAFLGPVDRDELSSALDAAA